MLPKLSITPWCRLFFCFLFEIRSICSLVVPAQDRRIVHYHGDKYFLRDFFFHVCFWKLEGLKKKVTLRLKFYVTPSKAKSGAFICLPTFSPCVFQACLWCADRLGFGSRGSLNTWRRRVLHRPHDAQCIWIAMKSWPLIPSDWNLIWFFLLVPMKRRDEMFSFLCACLHCCLTQCCIDCTWAPLGFSSAVTS